VVDLVFHLHDLSLLAFLDHAGDAFPVQVGVLHLRRKGLGHLHGQTSGLLLSELEVPIGARPRWRRVVRMSARRS